MKIAHLSDLHFGTEHNDLTQTLLNDLAMHSPDFTVISGDFTQKGNKEEFEKSQNFLKALPSPFLCVPGNHDVPSRQLIQRFFAPFKKYKNYIDDNLCPTYQNEKLVITGINSARRAVPHWNWANGAVSDDQLEFIDKSFQSAGSRFKILVLHHPLHKAAGVPINVVIFGGEKAMNKIHKLGIDLVLTGHVHHASVTTIKKTVFLSAATALSSRIRYQENGYNMITLNDKSFEITHYTYKAPSFEIEKISRHKRHSPL